MSLIPLIRRKQHNLFEVFARANVKKNSNCVTEQITDGRLLKQIGLLQHMYDVFVKPMFLYTGLA